MERQPGAPAAYVDRTDSERRPPIGSVEVTSANAPFAKIREEWDKLSEKEQEEHIAKADWNPAAGTKERTH
jgi:hypothetical protein